MSIRTLIAVIISLFLCQGCSYKHFEKVRLMTSSDAKATKIINQLNKQNVHTFLYKSTSADKDALGTVQVVIQNFAIFNPGSANFSANAYAILDRVVALLNCYEEDVVSIQGGGNNKYLGEAKYSKALGLERAHKVAQYLWSQDVNASFVYAVNDKIPQDSVAIVFQKFRRY